MLKKIIIILLLSLIFAPIVSAAPAPWGLALNLETKECAGYWAGDEFTGYRLPEGWKDYRPVYESGSMWGQIKTEVGDCAFQIRKEEACCLELGYTFVSDNIGKSQMEKLRDPMILINRPPKALWFFLAGIMLLGMVVLAGAAWLIIFLKKKNKKP